MIHPDTGAICTGPPGEEVTIYPAQTLALGEKHEVEGATIQRFSDHYACSCPAWRFHGVRDVRQRTCAHLAEALGEAYEEERMRLDWAPHTPSKRTGSAQQARQRLDLFSSPESPATPQKRRRTSAPSTPSKSAETAAPLLLDISDAIAIEVEGTRRVVGRQDHRVHLLLASVWPMPGEARAKAKYETYDPTHMWISEKLDGVRALWDGRQLWSRRGKVWNAPAWFLAQLPPNLSLDGELWIGRGQFEYTSGVCRSNRQDDWKHVQYMVFDTPGWPDEPVEARWDRLRMHFPSLSSDEMQTPPRVCPLALLTQPAGVYFVEQVQCTGQAHLEAVLQHVLACGGEGTVLYKLKPTHDAEARVLGYEEGQNQCAGLVGSLLCETLTDPPSRFKVGSGLTDTLRRDPPAIGTLISFQYGSLGTQGVPRFPRYRGVVADRS
ncbi:hypothetical protein MBRA1_002941 [Malassezia brasiliensis]|uniref:SWIM-type domain-containing protein n=1 Tax=Malassezia brasiliensis TaxID=1821822 RepID=A0AAF0IPJ0_9BASI|nr:hypothetical protein MBRA1_002941 [Malassezia brasiliensis]